MKKKKINKSIKPDFMQKRFIHDPLWKRIYEIEDHINKVISDVYYGIITVRCEIEDLYVIRIQFKIDKKNYEYLISKRYNDFGFSIFNIDDIDQMYEESIVGSNKTIINDKFYLYNIYKIIFSIIKI